jgi:hypothetical protein
VGDENPFADGADPLLDEEREVVERPSDKPRRIEHRIWTERVGAWTLRAHSYRLGDEFFCEVDHFEPVEAIARASGPDRREVERRALDDARAAARRAQAS